jgi:TetR/AcrR family transcriptional repressor of nem operon
MQKRVNKFFQLHLDWLQAIIAEGVRKKELKAELSAARTAVMLLSTLQGASIVAWALKEPSLIKPAYRQVLETIIR